MCTGKSSKIGDGEFSSEDEYEHAMLTRPPTRVIPDPEDSEDSDDEEEEKLDRCSVLMRQLALESWHSFSWKAESENLVFEKPTCYLGDGDHRTMDRIIR